MQNSRCSFLPFKGHAALAGVYGLKASGAAGAAHLECYLACKAGECIIVAKTKTYTPKGRISRPFLVFAHLGLTGGGCICPSLVFMLILS